MFNYTYIIRYFPGSIRQRRLRVLNGHDRLRVGVQHFLRSSATSENASQIYASGIMIYQGLINK